jgi:hypothetical protein
MPSIAPSTPPRSLIASNSLYTAPSTMSVSLSTMKKKVSETISQECNHLLPTSASGRYLPDQILISRARAPFSRHDA